MRTQISLAHLLCISFLATIRPNFVRSQNWADRWKQETAKAALKEAAKAEIYNKEVRIVTRRYYATGEIRAIKNHSVLGTYFKYDPSPRDLSDEELKKALKAERRLEKAWNRVRNSIIAHQNRSLSVAEQLGWLDPFSAKARTLSVRDEIPDSVIIAVNFFKHLVEEVRANCAPPLAFETF